MMKRNGKSQVMLQILQCLIFAGTVFAGDFVEDKIEKTFQVAPGGRLTIDSDRGSIEVRTAARNVVDVEIEKKVKRKDTRAATEIFKDFVVTLEQKNGRDVVITAKHKRGKDFWNNGRNQLSVHFRITVPQKYNVDLKTARGSISIVALEGEVRVQTSGGSLHFGEIKGALWGQTSGGSIDLKGCQGNVYIKTSGGSLDVGNVDGEVEVETSGGSIHIASVKGNVTARTSGGGIRVEEAGQVIATTSGGSIEAHISRQPKGDCALETSGGSVTAYLADDIAVNVDAQTSGGRVSTDLPVAMTVQGEMSKNKLQGTINGGGPLLKLRTSGGNMRLLRYIQKNNSSKCPRWIDKSNGSNRVWICQSRPSAWKILFLGKS
ncbi:DUF4097 family beta strand repeat protein [Candidatus Poribacteria bacterium]|nr:DUF4097 family beta strand repeat protein [Candidatus Poribacteria bacterium]